MCHLQLEGYQCIKQGITCSNKGGLVMYLSQTEKLLFAGDFNINVLKINENEVFAEFFYTLISYSFYPPPTSHFLLGSPKIMEP